MENIAFLAFLLGGPIAVVFLVLGLLKKTKEDTLSAKSNFKKAGISIGVSIVGLFIFLAVAEPTPQVADKTNEVEVVEPKERPKDVEIKKEETPETTSTETPVAEDKPEQGVTTPPAVPADPSQDIEKLAKQIINEDLKNTTINKIEVNEHMGRNDGTYLVLPYLKWSVKNSAKTTMEMLEMYSDHLAAKLADDKNVSEITVFWEVPYHLEGNNVAKFMYERSGDGMAKVDKWSALQ